MVECDNPPIRAHSVQNGRVMDLLQESGHVKTPKLTVRSDDSLSFGWEDVGRNLATTFEGFCSVHDSNLFRAIDSTIFDETDLEQLFLYSYRAAAREVHASVEAMIRLQSGYQNRIEAGLDRGDQPELAGMVALRQMLIASSTWEYKLELDEALVAREHNMLSYEIVWLHNQQPTLAVSACFDLDNRPNKPEPPRVMLNIFPVSEHDTVVIFGFTRKDAPAVTEYLQDLLGAAGSYQKYLISRLVLMHAENFVVAPSAFRSWVQEKRDCMLQFALKTLHFNTTDENQHLYLF